MKYISQCPDETIPNSYRIDFVCGNNYLAGNVSYFLTSCGQAVIYRSEIYHEEIDSASKSVISLLVSGQARKVSPTCPTVIWAASADLWPEVDPLPTNDEVIANPEKFAQQFANRIAKILDKTTFYDSIREGDDVLICLSVGNIDDYQIRVSPGREPFDIEHHIDAFGEYCTA